ncbi:Putative NADH-flavin reductase [Kingella potus]|uniref:NADH-flavin reductase n=1 Tax=Kingella potus TaxID=265175 RepID=A0A377R4B4_9NEIS|nr:NAD(P)H-binding protein [Kingella potus]UOP00035.1 NAD(P)H-binding protein [Kingella potus]STR03331.1 Putative NADH-flavin reductase [Kingella potus]
MLMIFGANGKSGRALIARLRQNGFSDGLTAVLRRPAQADDPFYPQHQTQTVIADALDPAAVLAAVSQTQPDTVVSFVGGKNEAGERSDAAGNANIIEAVRQKAPNARFLLVTSMGCGEQYENTGAMFKQALGEAVLAKTEAENRLRQSGLDWVILRPCGLGQDAGGSFTLHREIDEIPRSYMDRNGLAAAVCSLLAAEQWPSETVFSVSA